MINFQRFPNSKKVKCPKKKEEKEKEETKYTLAFHAEGKNEVHLGLPCGRQKAGSLRHERKYPNLLTY